MCLRVMRVQTQVKCMHFSGCLQGAHCFRMLTRVRARSPGTAEEGPPHRRAFSSPSRAATAPCSLIATAVPCAAPAPTDGHTAKHLQPLSQGAKSASVSPHTLRHFVCVLWRSSVPPRNDVRKSYALHRGCTLHLSASSSPSGWNGRKRAVVTTSNQEDKLI